MYQGFAKFIRGKVFSVMFLLVSLLLIGYVSLRIGSVLEYYFAVKYYLCLLLILLVFFSYMFFYQNSKKKEKKTRKIYEVCSVILSFILNLTLCLLTTDLLGLFISLSNDSVYFVSIMISVLLTLYGFTHAKHLYVKKYYITLNKEDKPVKLALLSDIHIGTFIDRKQLKRIVNQTNGLNCDYILIAGDTFNEEAFEHCNLSEIAEELRGLKAKKGIYATLGNHDPVSTNPKVTEFFKKSEIKLLIDDAIEVEDFIIIGRDDVNANPNRKCLTELLQIVDADKPKILIDHNPVGINDGITNNVDLVVCGHTHKGQFFPATLFTKWSYGKQRFYGYSKTRETHSIVSAGVGYFQMPMRVGTNSEIVEIDIG